MKKMMTILIVIVLTVSFVGCIQNDKKIKGNIKTYYELDDGTWSCDNITYQYRIEIKGRLPNAVCDSVYVYLSNIPDISFKRAYMASGLSSNSEDYFSVEEAVLVHMD